METKKIHKVIKLIQIAVALVLIAGLVELWESSLAHGQKLLRSQAEDMARLLVQQTAYGAAPALQLQNDEQLQWLTSALVADPKVMSAAVYGESGTRLSFAQSVSNESLEPGSEELNALLAPYPPYVEQVNQGDKNLGYVEVRLDPKLFLAEIEHAHRVNTQQQQVMLLVAGLIGMLLSRALTFRLSHFNLARRFFGASSDKKASAATESKPSDPPSAGKQSPPTSVDQDKDNPR